MPGWLTVGVNEVEVNPFGPVHDAVAPDVDEEPPITTEVVVQVNTLSAPALTFGAFPFKVTIAVSFALHPVVWSVTVNMYVPADVAVGVKELDVNPFGPIHEAVAPPVVEEPFSVTDVVVQVNVLSEPALTFGGVVF